jgi:glycosyltransferase involved in cell wall biosynthesis
MMSDTHKTRVLIFIGSLRSGGKERRLIELLSYLKESGEFDLMVAVTQDIVHYPRFYELDIPYYVIKKRWKKNDLTVFYQFYKICQNFKPHLVHTWGRIQTFYALPAIIHYATPLVNSQITSAPPKSEHKGLLRVIDRINFHFSKFILSNSKAGIESYDPPAQKCRVIYNGINMGRFINLPSAEHIKSKYGITTPYTIIMSASFSPNKDYDTFFQIAKRVTQLRDDITFIGVGACHDEIKFKELLERNNNNPRILFPGRIDDVEALVNACDIGLLFSNKSVHGEGISNSIMEYMALSKPVIANDAGGTREILQHNTNGYLIQDETVDTIADMVNALINEEPKRRRYGEASRRIIEDAFSLKSMGQAFEALYQEAKVESEIDVAYPLLSQIR